MCTMSYSTGIFFIQALDSRKIPWKEMLTSPMIWAVAGGAICWDYSFVMKYVMLPTYIDEVLKANIVQNGWVSAISISFYMIVVTVTAVVSDKLIQHGCKVITVRKLMWGLGFMLSGGVGCALGYMNTDNLAVMVVTISLWSGLTGMATSGAYLALAEYAPLYAGITTSMSNFVGQMAAFCAPLVIKAITSEGTETEWRNVFFLSGAVDVFGSLIFVIFGQSGIPEWATHDGQSEKKNLLDNDEK